jgi:hypothetical protein
MIAPWSSDQMKLIKVLFPAMCPINLLILCFTYCYKYAAGLPTLTGKQLLSYLEILTSGDALKDVSVIGRYFDE